RFWPGATAPAHARLPRSSPRRRAAARGRRCGPTAEELTSDRPVHLDQPITVLMRSWSGGRTRPSHPSLFGAYEELSYRGGDRDRRAGDPIDVDMHPVAERSEVLSFGGQEAQRIRDAGPPEAL